MNNESNTSVVEAIVLASPEPVSCRRIADVHEDLTPSLVKQAICDLNNRYMESGSSFRIRELAGGFQFHIIPEYSGYVEELFCRRRKMRLTKAALETLAIVSYRQPVTKTQIEHIRGVSSDGVLHNLLEKKLITIRGRATTVGKPLQYGTTNDFLKFFGLNQLEDLPQMGEIEELIRSQDSQNQTELELPQDEDAEVIQKLNVADGTFDPAEWENADQDVDGNGGQTEVSSTSAPDSTMNGEAPGESTPDEDQEQTGSPPLAVGLSSESSPTMNGEAPGESTPDENQERSTKNDTSEDSNIDSETPKVIVDIDAT